jgi:hypothetical protein
MWQSATEKVGSRAGVDVDLTSHFVGHAGILAGGGCSVW